MKDLFTCHELIRRVYLNTLFTDDSSVALFRGNLHSFIASTYPENNGLFQESNARVIGFKLLKIGSSSIYRQLMNFGVTTYAQNDPNIIFMGRSREIFYNFTPSKAEWPLVRRRCYRE